MANFDLFLEAYNIQVIAQDNPDQSLLATAQSTLNLLARGRTTTISPLIRATCRQLNVPINKKSIQRFLTS